MKTKLAELAKYQLLDYVTKREFNDFKDDMRDFRDEMREFRENTETRFRGIDKRLDEVDRKMDELKEESRVHTGAILDQMKHDYQAMAEYIKHTVNK